MLSPIPNKKSRISRGDCIASLIFLALFSCLLIFAPQLIGAYSVNGRDVSYVPVFNLGRWDVILPVLLFAMAVGFFNEIIRLIYGCYCKMVLLSSIVTNCIGIVLAFIVLKLLPFWNANFAQEVATQFDDTFKFKVFWQNKMILGWDGDFLSNVLLAIIVIASVGEIITTAYKTARYGTDR